MASVDTLVDNATSRANSYASATDFLVAELRSFIREADVSVNQPADIDISAYTLPTYDAPTETPTPTPVYEETTIPFPTAPELQGVGTITPPAARTEPTISTTGLFEHVLPSTNLPTIDETPPDFAIDDLVAEISAVALPSIQEFDFPEIHDSALGDAPTVTLPTYEAPALPDEVRDPEDYAAQFEAKYATMSRDMQAFVDDKVADWIDTYAPEYNSWVSQLQSKVTNDMVGGEALPDQFEAAMFTRAQGRAQREYDADMIGLLDSFKRIGTMELPGAVNSGILQARFKRADALANQATDVYIERRKSEVQHVQFVMNLASSQINSVRGVAISYAQTVGANLGLAVQYASNFAEAAGKVFDHLLARVNLRLSVLKTVDEQFKSKLAAALAVYDGYKLELEAEKSRTDVDLAKVRQIEARINAQDLQIKRYSAVVDAVGRKVSVETLKRDEYDIRAKILDSKIRSQLASFEAYKAAMSGDQSKLQGELSKLEVFNSQLRMDGQILDAQVKQVGAAQATNDAKTQNFRAQADMYRMGADVALQKFTAQAEVKKLAQSLYGQELSNAIEEFKVGLELPRLMINVILQQYQLRMQSAIETAKIELDKVRIAEQASMAAVGTYQSMASSALGSLNTMVSSAISASA